MVNNLSVNLDTVFQALSNPIRRDMLERLAVSTATVGELKSPYDISMPAVTKHLNVLERARLIERHQQGRVVTVSLSSEPMRDALDFLTRYRKFWAERLDNLERYIGEKRKKN
jgi:DNA-binding transcriptional ArsR family regulator